MKSIPAAAGIMVGMIASWPVHASDEHGSFIIYGDGTKSCGWFASAVEGAPQDRRAADEMYTAMAWANGYVTAYNKNTTGTDDVLGGVDLEGMQRWLYNFCRSQPLASFATAVELLTKSREPR